MHASKFAARLAQAFHLEAASTLALRGPGDDSIVVVDIRNDVQCAPPAGPLPEADATLVCVHLRNVDDSETWLDGRSQGRAAIAAGTCTFLDLRRRAVVRHAGAFHFLGVFLPHGETGHADGPRPDAAAPGDPVLFGLANSLLPFMDGRLAHNPGTVEHALRAFAAHVAHGGRARAPARPPCRGGLAPWQQRRARELMGAHLAEGIGLDTLAAACGLSRSGFLRAFRESFGVPPHQWLLRMRVDRAVELMRDRTASLSEIAILSGFFDQSHFSRAFSQRMGMSPGAWRRARQAADLGEPREQLAA